MSGEGGAGAGVGDGGAGAGVGDGGAGAGVGDGGAGAGVGGGSQLQRFEGQYAGTLLQFAVHHESVACAEIAWHCRTSELPATPVEPATNTAVHETLIIMRTDSLHDEKN